MTTQPSAYIGDITPAATVGIQAVTRVPWRGVVWQYPGYEIAFADGVASLDSTPPVITPVTPTPGVAPGVTGGFSSDFRIAKTTPIVIDVTDTDPGISFVFITSGDGTVVFGESNFQGGYVLGSSRQPIAQGTRYSILPTNLWPEGADPTQSTFVSLKVYAVDGAGNVVTQSLVYEIPAAVTATELTTQATVVPGAKDHLAAMLARVCQQFRDSN